MRNIFALIPFALLSIADSASALSLSQALAQVYSDSPALEAARADLRALDENAPMARAGRRPQLAFSSSTQVSLRSSSGAPEGMHVSRSGFHVEQPLYTGGRVDAAVEEAELAVFEAQARLETLEQQVLFAGIEAYAAVLSAERQLSLAMANRVRSERILDNTRDRYRLGGTTGTEVALAESHLLNAEAQAEAIRAELIAARAMMEAVVGMPADALEPVTEPDALPVSIDEMRDLLRDHPEMRAAVLAVELADATVDVADRADAASMSLNGEAFYIDQPAENVSMEPDVRVGFAFDMPLYRGGGDQARSRQARQARSARGHDLRAVERRLDAELVAAHAAHEGARLRLGSLEARRRAARMAIDGLRQEALLGVASMTDVLDAEETLFETEIELERLQQQRLVAAWRVLAASGQLNAERLGLDVVAYAPDHHFEQARSRWFGRKIDDDAIR
ncbi:MAG: TolC family protein [Geminicoccaceae bacterium]